MDTKTISTVEFIRHFGRYHDEAQRSPITLTKHGRPSVVVLSADVYERLLRDDPRRVYAAGETPPELADLLLSELERQSSAYREEGGKDD
ncbi:type II toxin-antitoxin system Phd/YefM family antitoxin (plasmid) [Rhizobium ruizarguesonis]|uniref:type II toxin-antitoxin system Phd/YefM family antitoxin n=1 Tax=Rhizobium ruizarguesonis TaxID=2081791 RepID=UPI001031A866|nr:type II toxin-antitoxin system Phd/YefM family antitoxin [Rhizobium ruizarguesonis]TBB15002.1 type II toxin-antitoxin system Phd/YefM family antitoxin [Rhizobium ruizarguesonis]